MSEKLRLIEKLIGLRNELAIEPETKNIDKEIKHFLMKHCVHDVITDYIDITPNSGMNIKYCAKCGLTL